MIQYATLHLLLSLLPFTAGFNLTDGAKIGVPAASMAETIASDQLSPSFGSLGKAPYANATSALAVTERLTSTIYTTSTFFLSRTVSNATIGQPPSTLTSPLAITTSLTNASPTTTTSTTNGNDSVHACVFKRHNAFFEIR